MITPTRAYDLLTPAEKQMVDDYVTFAVQEQNRKRQRIYEALFLPIPSEYIKRSRDALYKPLLRAATAERLREAADAQDLSPSRVIAEHASIAFSNISDYVEPAGFGEIKAKDISNIPTSKMAAVKSIEVKPTAFGLHTKVVLHDKHPSLKAMGEMMGLVAPDRPPALEDYTRPPKDVTTASNQSPEQEYAELLTEVSGVKNA